MITPRQRRRMILLLDDGGSRWLTFEAPAIGTTLALSALGVPASGRGTYLFRGVLAATGTGTSQTLMQVDSGATTNRYLAGGAAGSALIQLTRTNAGAATTSNTGAVTAGTEFFVGMAVNGDGTAILSLNAAASVSVTGGPTASMTTFRVGANVSGAAAMGGSIVTVRVLPGEALSDADLRAALLDLSRS